MEVLKYDITLLMLFSLVGIVVKLFIGQTHSSDGSYGPASASIWGYGVVALAVWFSTSIRQFVGDLVFGVLVRVFCYCTCHFLCISCVLVVLFML